MNVQQLKSKPVALECVCCHWDVEKELSEKVFPLTILFSALLIFAALQIHCYQRPTWCPIPKSKLWNFKLNSTPIIIPPNNCFNSSFPKCKLNKHLYLKTLKIQVFSPRCSFSVIWLSKANLCCLVLCAPHIKPASFNIGLQKIKRRNIFGGWKIMKTRIHFWKPLSWKNNNFSKQNLSRRQRQLTNLERQYFPDWKFYSSKKVQKFLMGTNLLF